MYKLVNNSGRSLPEGGDLLLPDSEMESLKMLRKTATFTLTDTAVLA